MLVNSGNLFYYVKKSNYSKEKKCTGDMGIQLYSDLILILFRTIIPIFTMGILSILIIRKLSQINRIRKKAASPYQAHRNNSHGSAHKDHQFTFTVVSMNFVFILFNIPTTLVYIVRHIYLIISKSNTDANLIAKMDLMWTISFNLGTLYFSSFFLLNTIFNKLFRAEVFKLMGVDANEMGHNYTRNQNVISEARGNSKNLIVKTNDVDSSKRYSKT